jgi:hypothetical protein
VKPAGILVGVLLLLVVGLLEIPQFNLNIPLPWGSWGANIPNPLYYLFTATPLFQIPAINFPITITDIILGLMILVFIVSIFGK